MRRKIVLLVVLCAVTYVVSYWIIRENNTIIHERDGCPSRGCVEVHFPGNGVYMIFTPIYLLDKNTDGDTEFYLVN